MSCMPCNSLMYLPCICLLSNPESARIFEPAPLVQTFCVGECMSYCTKTHCEEKPAEWSHCQNSCIGKFMEVEKKDINFVDFSMCMSTCTNVPISPYGHAV